MESYGKLPLPVVLNSFSPSGRQQTTGSESLPPLRELSLLPLGREGFADARAQHLAQDRFSVCCRGCGHVLPNAKSVPYDVARPSGTSALCTKCDANFGRRSGPNSSCESILHSSDGESERMECDAVYGDSDGQLKTFSSLSDECNSSKRRRTTDSEAMSSESSFGRGSGDRSADLRSLAKVEKKEKEKKSRDGHKSSMIELEKLVLEDADTEALTKLNHNNSRASGLKYKKGQILDLAVRMTRRLKAERRVCQQENEALKQRLEELQRDLAMYQTGSGVQQWMANCTSTNTPPASPVTLIASHERRRGIKL